MARIPTITDSVLTRFKSHTARRGACLLWTGSKNNGGYGQFNCTIPGEKRHIVKTHQFAWIVANGPIPPGLSVCHRCDVRHCVEPAHLFLGTHADNNRDMFAKGRGHRLDGSLARGSKNVNAKLTAQIVAQMRAEHARGVHAKILGEKHGVSHQAAWMAVTGRTWRHVGEAAHGWHKGGGSQNENKQ